MVDFWQRATVLRVLLFAALGVALWPGAAEATSGRSWTLVAHVCAHGDLQETGAEYAEQLVDAARSGGWPLRLALAREDGRVDLHSVPGAGPDDMPVRPPGICSQEAIESLLRWASRSAPAERYALIVYGHHLGAAESPEDGLSFVDIDAAIMGGLGRPVDLLVLERCYGASMHAAWELRGSAQLLVGSPGRRTSAGLRWARIIGDAPPSPAVFATEIATRCVADDDPESGSKMIALRPSGSEAVAEALRHLTSAAAERIMETAPLLTRARSQAASSGGDERMVDLRDLCSELADLSDGEFRAAALATVAAVDDSLLVTGDGSRGPSIGFRSDPAQTGNLIEDRGDFADGSGWSSLIMTYRGRLHGLVNRPPGDEPDDTARRECGESRTLSKQVLQSWPALEQGQKEE